MAQRQAADDWARERGLTMEQAFTLGYLAEDNPGARQREIAAITRTTPASVSRLITGLQRRRLVERRTEDGDERSNRVYATDEAAELIAGFEEAIAAVDARLLSPLSAKEQKTLHELLTKIVDRLPQP